MPVRLRADSVALLYLENELVPGVVTPDRLVALELLAAQAAISLENARLLERERTGRIEVPALFMWSDGDRFVSRAAADLCGRYVTGPYRFEVLEGASHWLPEQVPDRVADLLVAHFARASGG